jgi:hypothetical protein
MGGSTEGGAPEIKIGRYWFISLIDLPPSIENAVFLCSIFAFHNLLLVLDYLSTKYFTRTVVLHLPQAAKRDYSDTATRAPFPCCGNTLQILSSPLFIGGCVQGSVVRPSREP